MHEVWPAWRRPAPDCVRVENNVIVSDPGDEYTLSEQAMYNLPNALAKVYDVAGALKFTAVYGELGYRWLFSEAANVPGDPVPWFLEQAATVRFALRLIESLQEEGAAAVKEVLEGARLAAEAWMAEQPALAVAESASGVVGGMYRLALGPASRVVRRVTEPYSGDESDALRRHAQQLVAFLVNENAGNIHWTLAEQNRRIVKVPIGSKSLIQVLWIFVARIALAAQDTKERRVRLCAECQTPFYAFDLRQRFCPPDPGSDVSLCAGRHRQRRLRRRRKEQNRAAE